MEDMLQLERNHNVLEIGTGCGYHTAITSEMVGQKGKVTTMEIIPELTEIVKELSEPHQVQVQIRLDTEKPRVEIRESDFGW